MPLYEDALEKIKKNLLAIERGEKAPIQEIGFLSVSQHELINQYRSENGLPALECATVLYMGRHHFESRSRDGYTVDDMLIQIQSVLHDDAMVTAKKSMIGVQNSKKRDDGYGNQVHDLGVLELSSRKPKAELYSVIPKGDEKKPTKKII